MCAGLWPLSAWFLEIALVRVCVFVCACVHACMCACVCDSVSVSALRVLITSGVIWYDKYHV